MTLAKMLPMAIVMIAGPQILSSIFLATSENWRRNSIAYTLGAACSITAIVTAAYFLSSGASDQGASSDTLDFIVLALLVVAAIYVFATRKTATPPKWMGKLQGATPKFSFRLGFLLLGVFPTDILTAVAVGSFVNTQGDPWWHVLPFVALTLLLVASPALMVTAFGARAEAFLPKVRDWMNSHSWIVSELVIGLFIALTINSIAG